MRGTHCLWWLVAVITTITRVSAEQFTFEFFTDNTCTTIKSGPFGGGSWTFESDQCNAWTSSIPNSMKVLSCSSKCICFAQSPNSSSCGDTTNSNVKESCSNTCEKDNQGSWLQIRDFEGCDASLQVDDSEYSCPCTNMSPNSVCTTASPTPPPTSPPTSPPTPPPTPPPTNVEDEECNDSPLRVKVWNENQQRFKMQSCDWVGRIEEKIEERCASISVNGETNAAHCAKTCGVSNCSQQDSNSRFKVENPSNQKLLTRYCTFAANNPAERCTWEGMTDTCRATCAGY